jgi:alanine racemase
MATSKLTIDLAAIAENYASLDDLSKSSVETAAVVKADAYGLGASEVTKSLATKGVRTFFVALAEEGIVVRNALGSGPRIFVFSGHMDGDTKLFADADLIPFINSPQQAAHHTAILPNFPFGLQLDTGMNRLGVKANDLAETLSLLASCQPELVVSHLACADDPAHPQNAAQLANFISMTSGIDAPKSLAATGGTLLGPEYHFDMCRPGVGLYGGKPFSDAKPVVRLSIPVIQERLLEPEENVGYAATWTAHRPTKIATLAAGYADGLIRAMSNRAVVYAGDIACPIAGRVSMDLLTVDVTHLDHVPASLDILCDHQTVDHLADEAETIGYEILTSLGQRYTRRYIGG